MKSKLVRESLEGKLSGPSREEVEKKIQEDPVGAFHNRSIPDEMRELAKSYMPDLPKEFEKELRKKGFQEVNRGHLQYMNVHPKTLYKEGKYDQLWLAGFDPEEQDQLMFSVIYGDGHEAIWLDISKFDEVYDEVNELIKDICTDTKVNNVYKLSRWEENELVHTMKANFNPASIF